MRAIWLIFPGMVMIAACARQPTLAEKQQMLADGDLTVPAPRDTLDRGAILQSLDRLSKSDVAACVHDDDVIGEARVKLTLDQATGHTVKVELEPPFDQAANADCIVAALTQITVPPFVTSPGPLDRPPYATTRTVDAKLEIPDSAPGSLLAFDTNAAKDSINAVDFSSCKKMVTSEAGKVFVTFSPRGPAASAHIVGVSGPPKIAKCIERTIVSNAHVPPFGGTVRRWVSVPITIPNE